MFIKVKIVILLLISINIAFSQDNINSLILNIPKLQSIIGSEINIIPLSGGFSGDKVYFINEKFVLKTFKNYSSQRVKLQNMAGNINIAPKILYSNTKHKIILMEFIENNQLPRDQNTIPLIAKFLKKLHSIETSEFTIDIDPYKMARKNVDYLNGKNISKKIIERISNIKNIKKYNNKNTICHNDLNPNNILFKDGEVVAIDWDSAGINDPFYDIATISLWYRNIPNIEKKLLRQYLSHEPDKNELEHLSYMQKLVKIIIGGNLVRIGVEMGANVTHDLPIDNLSTFLQKIGLKKVNLDKPIAIYQFGLVILAEI